MYIDYLENIEIRIRCIKLGLPEYALNFIKNLDEVGQRVRDYSAPSYNC